jgi:hypothetical protein
MTSGSDAKGDDMTDEQMPLRANDSSAQDKTETVGAQAEREPKSPAATTPQPASPTSRGRRPLFGT